MDGSYKRAYGKGGTASSRAVLSDHFLDENEVDKQMSKMSLTQAESPLLSEDDAKPMPPTSVIPVARNSKAVRSVPVNSLPSVSFDVASISIISGIDALEIGCQRWGHLIHLSAPRRVPNVERPL